MQQLQNLNAPVTVGQDWLNVFDFCKTHLEQKQKGFKLKKSLFTAFQKTWLRSIPTTLATCETHPPKAVYIEYFYDGGDASDCNVFFCKSFDTETEDWASDFYPDKVLEGGSVKAILDVLEDDWEEDFKEDALLCIDEILYRICLSGFPPNFAYPISFAQHDAPVRICVPNAQKKT